MTIERRITGVERRTVDRRSQSAEVRPQIAAAVERQRAFVAGRNLLRTNQSGYQDTRTRIKDTKAQGKIFNDALKTFLCAFAEKLCVFA
jgi:hypothetical protein